MRMRRRTPAFPSPLLATLMLAVTLPAPVQAAVAPASPAGTERQLVDLGVLPGGSYSFADGINDHGAVVGFSETADGTEHAVIWQHGRTIDLGTLHGGPSDDSGATDINDHGVAVGWSSAPGGDFVSHAVMWRHGQIVDLGTLGGSSSVATGINDRGEVVGWSTASDGLHAFLWRRGRMIDLGGRVTQALAINERGQVLGSGPGVPHLWQDGEWTPLGLPAGAESATGWDINDRGQVVGYSVEPPYGEVRAVVWNDGVPTHLEIPESMFSQAFGINDRGQIVGTKYIGEAFLWERGEVTNLPGFDNQRWTEATAINDRGQAVGWSATTEVGNPRVDGHAVLWQ